VTGDRCSVIGGRHSVSGRRVLFTGHRIPLTGHLLLLLLLAALSSTAFADRYLNRPGWRMTFQDEFTGSVLNTNKWTPQDAPNYANEEQQYYTPECAVVTNDNLVLISKNEGVWYSGYWWPYKSAKVTTAHKFDQQYGRFEVRAKMPSGKGLWPAHWMLGYNGWPPEIDLMEIIGSVPWRITVSVHWGPAPPPPLYPWDVGQTANRDIWAGDWTLDYHTFAVEWDWWGTKFYIDDGEVFANYRGVPHEPMYLILNTAVGGQWPGWPDWTTPWPAEHKIDYARAYERYGGTEALNDSFESGEEGTFADWNTLESGNITADTEASRARTGTRSATLTGRSNGQPNGSYLFQSLAASENEIWQAGVWVNHRADDPLQGSNSVRLKLEFLDGFGVFQGQPTRTVASSNSAPGYTFYSIRARAPQWTTHARVTVVFDQYDDAGGKVNVDDAQLTRITADTPRSLANAGFEDEEDGWPVSWSRFGTVSNAWAVAAPGEAYEGAGLLRIAPSTNLTGVLQDLPAKPGEPWTASLWTRARPGNALTGADVVRAKLEFANGSLQVLSVVTQVVASAASSTNWTNFVVSAGAPVNTAYARLVVERVSAGGGGEVEIDGTSLSTSADPDVLLNAGFEQSNGTNFPGWTRYGVAGANVRRDVNSAHARGGTNAVQIFGQFTGGQNESGLFQDLDAAPGEVWEAAAWAQNRPGDPLGGLNRGYLKIEFRDAGDGLLGSDVADAAWSNSPSYYQRIVVRRAAPPNTAKVRIVMAMVQQNNAGGSVNFDDADLRRLTVSEPRSILNGDFEQSADARIVNWSKYPSGAGNIRRDSSDAYALGGSAALQMYGVCAGDPNQLGLFQDLPAQAGEVWQAKVWGRNRPNDGASGNNSARLKIEFVDALNVLLTTNELTVLTSASPTNYAPFTLRREAPPGTSRARIVLEYSQVACAGGSVNFDNAEMHLVTAADVRELLNAGFEDGAGQAFPNWVRFGGTGNVMRDPQPDHAHAGASALQMFGAYTTDPNESGLYQTMPAVPGEVWEASAWARNRPGDALQGGNRVYLSLQFVGASNVVVLARESILVDAASSTNYTWHAVRETAPAGTTLVRVSLRVRQVGGANGSANVDDVSLNLVSPADQPPLLNGGFEQSSTSSIPNWAGAGAGVVIDPDSTNAHGGARALQMYGTATGAVTHVHAWQDVPTFEGQVCGASVWARNRPTDGLQGASVANLHLQFLGAGGQVVTSMHVKVADAASPSVYARFALVRPAPAGAATARLLLEVVQDGASPGSVNVDDASLGALDALTGAQGAGRIGWAGDLSPGAGEAVTVEDDLYIEGGASLEMFVGGVQPGTNHDQIVVGDTATLSGVLRVLLPGASSGQGSSVPFVPRAGQSFELFRMGARSGLFAGMDAPSGLGGPAFALDYSTTNVVLRVIREIDSDTDGLPDFWEVEHFGSRQGGDAVTDTDQDGQPNQDEFVTDTVPTNEASFFEVSGGGVSGVDVITWLASPSSTGRLYDVYWRTNLLDPAGWQPCGLGWPGNGGDLPLSITNELPEAVFRAGVWVP
jgi:beta-glucanase (GH16 family)